MNPLKLRKSILEGSRSSIHCLQNYERILLLREHKLQETAQLKANIRELLFLNKKLDEKLPKYDHDILHGSHSAPEKKSLPRKMPKIQEPARSELERLEDSLASIEEKLKSLE
jgi:hypothetical protein